MKLQGKTWATGSLALLIAFGAGWWIAPSGPDGATPPEDAEATARENTTWTCSMHPQIRQPEEGDCPICGMDLIPAASEEDGEGEEKEAPRLRLSERSAALMRIKTIPVQRGEAYAEVRLPGRIAVDETRLYAVSAWFPGRVERLFADFAGTRVRKGEHLLEIYSPELFGAQEEFLQALRASRQRSDEASKALAENARAKLGLLGLSEEQILAVEEGGEPTTHLIYYSPTEGIVTDRAVTAGQYVKTGTPLYTVADLSRVWVELEAYESDLAFLRYGQPVEVEVLSFPGRTFEGRIAFVDPEVDSSTRTAQVRVNLSNKELRLKPGMLATGTVSARVSGGGVAADANLAGKWISPMHPQIIKNEPGDCDVCGMPLVPAEEMGYLASGDADALDPLLIPASAPLFTGKRSLVYLRMPGNDRPTFEAREVLLGARLGDSYPVLEGLEEGDRVVVNGQFKIDSELQIRGRPSMMTPKKQDGEEKDSSTIDLLALPGREAFADSVDGEFGAELRPLLEAYLRITEALVADDEDGARAGLKEFEEDLSAIGQHRLEGEAHMAWMDAYSDLEAVATAMEDSPTVGNFRAHLQELTRTMERVYVNFGAGRLPAVNRALCPMVEGDKTGTWLQRGDVVNNPYWGEEMLRCGEVFDTLGGEGGE